MKRILFTLLFLCLCTSAFADHWVYVWLEDKSGVTQLDDVGLAKIGDIVAILPDTEQFTPSQTEQEQYAIVKVSGLTDSVIQQYTEGWDGLAFRKRKLNVSSFPIQKGIYPNTVNYNTIKNKVVLKNENDLVKYEQKRIMYSYFKRPIIRLANIITPKAYAETITTCNKTGEDYNTISLWEAAVDGDLVTATTQPTLHVYNDDGTLTDNVNVDGSTTSADYYMKVTAPAAERHGGVAGSGAHVHSTDTYNPAFYIQDDYFVVEWLEITRSNATPGSAQGNTAIYVPNGTNYAYIRYNIIHDTISTNEAMNGIQYQDNHTAGQYHYIYNNIIYDIDGSGIILGQYNALTFYVYNNTVYNASGTGISCAGPSGDTDGIYTVVNNISMANGTDYSGTLDTNTDNLSTGATVNFVSTTDDAQNFHLAAGSTDAVDQGTDLSATFTLDIDGTTRSGTWDIGADEYVSASTRNRLIIVQ